jgi:hypothetical protein
MSYCVKDLVVEKERNRINNKDMVVCEYFIFVPLSFCVISKLSIYLWHLSTQAKFIKINA